MKLYALDKTLSVPLISMPCDSEQIYIDTSGQESYTIIEAYIEEIPEAYIEEIPEARIVEHIEYEISDYKSIYGDNEYETAEYKSIYDKNVEKVLYETKKVKL